MSDSLELRRYIQNCRAISTHSHFIGGLFFDKIDLRTLLEVSYVNWSWLPLPTNYEQRHEYFLKVRNRSYFIWLEKALKQIYSISEQLNEDTYELFDAKIVASASERGSYEKLKEICLYDAVVNDSYWDYGFNHNAPEFFKPAYRINIFLNGYNKNLVDRENNSIGKFFSSNTYEEYKQKLKEHLKKMVQNGCSAFKCAAAYERGLNFSNFDEKLAENAYDNAENSTIEEVKAFSDSIMDYICKIAAELDVPFQIHTGLGQLYKTEAKELLTLIQNNLNTKFVLFHMSYPNAADVFELVHTYNNVYADLCWTPLISCEFSQRVLSELLDVCNCDRICWGCDTWTFEESYGARLAINFVLERVLTQKINDGFFDLEFSKQIVKNILLDNAKKLYKI